MDQINEERIIFSIIIPVYNVQEYLEQCVKSVSSQTFSSLEIILVDDGSTDSSGTLCDRLALKDSRIYVHHQKNRGLSGARNTGLALAKGEYVLFLDSDDFYPQNDFLERLNAVCRGEDVIAFNYARYTDHLHPPMLDYPQGTYQTDRLLRELISKNAYQSSACIKAVKRELLQRNGIFFEEGVLSEDIEWSAKVMCYAREIAIAPGCIYAYRVRMGSISKTVSNKHIDDQVAIINKMAKRDIEGSQDLRDAYYGYVAFQYSTLMINARLCKPRLERERIREIKEFVWLLEYDTNRIVKLIRMVYHVFGFEITSWLLLVYFKLFCK